MMRLSLQLTMAVMACVLAIVALLARLTLVGRIVNTGVVMLCEHSW
jgi:hypothetical protein